MQFRLWWPISTNIFIFYVFGKEAFFFWLSVCSNLFCGHLHLRDLLFSNFHFYHFSSDFLQRASFLHDKFHSYFKVVNCLNLKIDSNYDTDNLVVGSRKSLNDCCLVYFVVVLKVFDFFGYKGNNNSRLL